MVQSLGADAVFDYKSCTVGEDIRKFTHNRLYHVFDCISTDESARICAEALSNDVVERKPIYSAVLYCAFPRDDVQVNVTVAHTIFGESFTKPELGPENFPANAEDYEFGKKFWKLSEKFLIEGMFQVHRPDIRSGGLEGVLEGLDELMRGKVSGKKLVYTLAAGEKTGAAKT